MTTPHADPRRIHLPETGIYAEPKYVADFLAERGVRVVGEERS